MSGLTAGNRLPVSEIGKRRHFFFKTRAFVLDPSDVAVVVKATKDIWAEQKLTLLKHGLKDEVGNVQCFSPGYFQETVKGQKDTPKFPGAPEALGRMFTTVATHCTKSTRVDIISCRWAMPHVDESFSGGAFHSIVLHTGPSPYVMQTLHTRMTEGRVSKIVTTTSNLEVGDSFIFDPTTAHFATPTIPHQDSLLILAQVELKDDTVDDRRKLLEAYPRFEGPKDPFADTDEL